MLTHFAEALRPEARPVDPVETQAWDALRAHRQPLRRMRVTEWNRLGSCPDPTARAGLERHLAWLEAEAAGTDRRLAEAVPASPAWRKRAELRRRSLPGLGHVTSLTPRAAVPGLGTLDRSRHQLRYGSRPSAIVTAAVRTRYTA